MSNDYYNVSGSPGTRSHGDSAVIRAEFVALAAAFAKLPTITGNANKAVVVNAGANALTVTAAALALAVALTTAGSGAITLRSTGATDITLPTTGTVATLAGAETLTNKTITTFGGAFTFTPANASATLSPTGTGTVTINPATVGALDNIVIGANTAKAATFTTVTHSTSGIFNGSGSGATTLVAAAAASGTLTLPAATDTLVGKATVDELTNKTLTASVGKGVWTASGTWTLPAVTLGGAITYGGVTLTNAVTGTGNMVLSASPTFTGTLAAATITASGNLTVGSGAVIASSATTLYVSAGGASNLYLATNNAAAIQVQITHTASATRYITLTGSNGGNSSVGVSAGYLNLLGVDNSAKVEIGRYSAGAAYGYLKANSSASGLKITDPSDSFDQAIFTSAGYFKVSPDGTYDGTTGAYHELIGKNDSLVAIIGNHSATLTNAVNGLQINFSAAAPNSTVANFIYLNDSSATRGTWRSNGGIANFSANNVNLSTRLVKNGYRVYSDTELTTYEAFLEDVDFGVWKYNDQTHDDFNHGPTVEGLRAALRKHGLTDEEQSLIGEFDDGMDGIYTEDLKNIAIASLVASNKRLRTRVATLEGKVLH